MGGRLHGYAVSVVLLAAVLFPLRFERGRDSFPLSSYPMFARAKTSAAMQLHYFLGLTEAGERRYLRPELVANQEVLQARAVIAHAVRRGPADADQLCRQVADRVAAEDEVADVVELRLVEGRHDAIAFLVDGDVGSERVVARCGVPR